MLILWSIASYGVTFVIIYYVTRYLLARIPVRNLSTKPVLITGCDTGFGHMLALKLLQNNIPVFAGCLGQGLDLQKKAKGLPGHLEVFPLDVTKQDSVDNALKFVSGKTNGLWGVVNNAGILGINGPDDWLGIAEYQLALDVNTLGVIRVTQAFKQLVKRCRGRIVTVASIAGRCPFVGTAPYCVSKYAVEGYCDVLRHELRPFKVQVSILEPGFFATDLLNTKRANDNLDRLWNRLPTDTKLEYGEDFVRNVKLAFNKIIGEWASPKTELVVNAYYHALTSLFPHQRYYPGNDSAFFFIPLSMLPTPLQDSIYRLLELAKGRPLPRVCRNL